MKGSALKPTFLVEEIKKVEVQKVPIEDEEKHLYALSKHKGWEIISERIKTRIDVLKRASKDAMATGLNFEQIGFNSVVLSAVEDIVDEVFNDISNAVEAIENGNK